MDEFEIIDKYFKPLTLNSGESLGLMDDAAILNNCLGSQFVIACDTINENVHFFSFDTPYLIAKKLLRVNLSDLAAMGANPYAYLLSLSVPRDVTQNWLAEFSASLQEDIKIFGGKIIGGDTTSSKGLISLSLTAIGQVKNNMALKRSGAKIGDKIFVTGTIGDSYLGLKLLDGSLKTEDSKIYKYLTNRYHLPLPRLDISQKIIGIASAAMDISDGLFADIGKLCKASNCGFKIMINSVPISDEAKFFVDNGKVNLEQLCTNGDDYELVFTANEDKIEDIIKIAAIDKVSITQIGVITDIEDGCKVLGGNDKKIIFKKTGYNHFV